MVCSIIQPALSILMKHLVIGQRQKAPNFSAFHWSPHGRMVSIGQHFVTTRVVHLPKRTETSLITEADLITEPDQVVWAVHSCNSWLSSISHPRHLKGKRTAQKDANKDITSDSQVNSNFPYSWSPASLTFKNYFYLFLY